MTKRPAPENFIEAVKSGMSRKELREHFGAGHRNIVRWLTEAGLDTAPNPNGKRPDYRKAVADMKPMDAVEFLLSALEAIIPRPDAAEPILNEGFSPIQSDILLTLSRFDYISIEHIEAICMRGRDQDRPPEIAAIQAHITHLRRAFEARGWDAKITIDRFRSGGIGYHLRRGAGFQFPWEVV